MKNLFYSEDINFNKDLLNFLSARKKAGSKITESVSKVIKDVKKSGDSALVKYSKKFDDIDINKCGLFFKQKEIQESIGKCDAKDKSAIDIAINRILDFHLKQMPKDVNWKDNLGIELGWIWRPIERVGVYVPGGKASYPSSAIMNIAPARIAGVEDIVLVSPCPKGLYNPLMIYASASMQIKKILRLGGAQAVAALAFGTETVEKVDKITGPGNAYVAEAKKQVFGEVGIDSVAGPSEVLLICDKSMPEKIAAIDLLSQAEHDENAQSILITDDRDYALEVAKEIENYLGKLKRKEIARSSWKNFGAIIVVPNFMRAIEISNLIAPEHLQLCFLEAEDHIHLIKNAGSVFLGYWSPEAMGDYITGSNHVLPTNRTAKFSSGLSVMDFLKRVSVTKVNREGFKQLGSAVVRLANSENLQAHSLSVSERLKDL